MGVAVRGGRVGVLDDVEMYTHVSGYTPPTGVLFTLFYLQFSLDKFI